MEIKMTLVPASYDKLWLVMCQIVMTIHNKLRQIGTFYLRFAALRLALLDLKNLTRELLPLSNLQFFSVLRKLLASSTISIFLFSPFAQYCFYFESIIILFHALVYPPAEMIDI